MTIALGCAAAVLAAAVLILALKVCALKSSLRELAVQAEEKYRESSNAPLSPQSADKGVQRLAGELTAQLDEVIAARRQYAEGNGELSAPLPTFRTTCVRRSRPLRGIWVCSVRAG